MKAISIRQSACDQVREELWISIFLLFEFNTICKLQQANTTGSTGSLGSSWSA
jgi:hypothetical protein